jgi:hypothetical protein
MAKAVKNRRALITHYRQAKSWIECSPYVQEVEWQETRRLSEVTEPHFLREYAWVVLNSGFREAIVRRYFDYISLCFCDWESAEAIEVNARPCVDSTLPIFGNLRKLEAIVATARLINRNGFAWLKSNIDQDAIATFSSLPFIGPVTTWHLAKNLGADVAKPDRHLVRLANRFGYEDVNRMCREIQVEVGDRVAVADIVLWRFEEQCRSRLGIEP